MNFSRIWQPLLIGRTTVRNRIFVSGHFTNFGVEHLMTDRHLAYHRERARGGVGLIITEAIRVHPTSLDRGGSLTGYLPECVAAFAKVVRAVQDEGSKMFAQLVHTGRHAASVHGPLWAPSPIPWAAGTPIPHEMDDAEIQETLEYYALCGRNAAAAGFDGVEVHLGHGHLPQQFLSPTSNRRTDRWGGSEENRLAFSLEVLRAVRRAVGDDFTLGVRISAEEFLPGGLTIDDMTRIAATLAAREKIAFINVSQSHYHASFSLATQIADMSFPPGAFLDLPRRIKEAVPSLPIFAICRIEDLRLAESVLAAGTADMVGMTRAHIADPHLLRKAGESRAHEVRPCLYSNQGCISQVEQNNPMRCVMNPDVGREVEWLEHEARRLGSSAAPKKVLVVGGGAAGLAAARGAALDGHHVELWEQAPEIGGQLNLVSSIGTHRRFATVKSYFERELARLGAVVETNRTADATAVRAGAFDAVIIATGSRFPLFEIPGFANVRPLAEALASPVALGEHVALIDNEGDWAGVAVAEQLAGQGKRVSLVTSLGGLAPRVSLYSRLAINQRVGRLAVKVYPLRRVVRGEERGLFLQDVLSADEERLDAVDAAVFVSGRVAINDLQRELRSSGLSSVLVGDAVAPRTVLEAIAEGTAAGRSFL